MDRVTIAAAQHAIGCMTSGDGYEDAVKKWANWAQRSSHDVKLAIGYITSPDRIDALLANRKG